ncbi:MAG: aminoacyl-tRNA hydrolase [Omnitrophica bacterium]|nr:aminoacyl-tRNA hydrolase [Candidatus Omnitrophota bacterium]
MKLIIGLGNPGLRYKKTRHNIGFLVIAEISKQSGIALKKKKYNGLFAKGSISGKKIGLFMPETYMNMSGNAVRSAIKGEGVLLKDALIICDDINLKFGFIRLREKGTSGGHNGLSSIIDHVGTNEFPRLRVGIGKDEKVIDMPKFVLRTFDSGERPLLKGIVKTAAECAITWANAGPEKAMSLFNKRQPGISPLSL